jgi:uncharacterized cupin superfamily protein
MGPFGNETRCRLSGGQSAVKTEPSAYLVAHELTQFILSGSGELLLDEGSKPVRAGDVVVLTIGTGHDLRNTGSEDLRVVGFFAAAQVEQHWTKEVWEPGDLRVTGTPG